MIGTTSTEAKAAKAREAGADEVILYSQKDFVEEVNRITDGNGVNVIYDGIGKTTFEKGTIRTRVRSGHLKKYIPCLPDHAAVGGAAKTFNPFCQRRPYKFLWKAHALAKLLAHGTPD